MMPLSMIMSSLMTTSNQREFLVAAVRVAREQYDWATRVRRDELEAHDVLFRAEQELDDYDLATTLRLLK